MMLFLLEDIIMGGVYERRGSYDFNVGLPSFTIISTPNKSLKLKLQRSVQEAVIYH